MGKDQRSIMHSQRQLLTNTGQASLRGEVFYFHWLKRKHNPLILDESTARDEMLALTLRGLGMKGIKIVGNISMGMRKRSGSQDFLTTI